jgi:hypothetical protein
MILKKEYSDLEIIVKGWMKDKIFDARGIKRMLDSVKAFDKIDAIISKIAERTTIKVEESELRRAYSSINRDSLVSLVSLVTTSLDLSKASNHQAAGKQCHIGIKHGLFQELDDLRMRYEALDSLMSQKLSMLSDDIKLMPQFMRKVWMMMIPSVGYFTVVTKCDMLFSEFIAHETAMSKSSDFKGDEDSLLEAVLGDTLRVTGWKLCFQTETDIYF